jgi:NCS1 family nucleobase:cation symporter-1
MLNSIDERVGIVIVGLVSLAATIYGHDLIHLYTRLMTYVSGTALLLSFIWICFVHGLPVSFFDQGAYSAVGFGGMVSVGALWQISYAPYVSDYSRYLPPGTGPKQAFYACYFGCVIGSILPMILGSIVGLAVGGDEVIASLAGMIGPIAPIVIALFAIGIAASSGMNLYCGSLSTITLGQTFLPRWQAGSGARIVIAIILFVISVLIAVLGKDNFLVMYTNFLDLLLYVMVPWTAVNLVDFYLIRHGEYDVPSFFSANGGIYGKYNWPALICYVLGILVQVPFISTDLYKGPMAKAMGGVDISWIVGLVVISPVYYFVVRAVSGERFSASPAAVSQM